jgi:hypothetical protein
MNVNDKSFCFPKLYAQSLSDYKCVHSTYLLGTSFEEAPTVGDQKGPNHSKITSSHE